MLNDEKQLPAEIKQHIHALAKRVTRRRRQRQSAVWPLTQIWAEPRQQEANRLLARPNFRQPPVR